MIQGKLLKAAKRFNLTPREVEALIWLAAGDSRKNIADRMDISIWTVDFHIDNIRRKFQAQNCVAIIVAALLP